MGSMVMGKCKIDKKKSCIAQTNCKHLGGYGKLPLGNIYTCHVFLLKTCKFEKADSRAFFHNLIGGFVDRRFGNPWEPSIKKIYRTK
jgi:hypothetical protein